MRQGCAATAIPIPSGPFLYFRVLTTVQMQSLSALKLFS